MRLVGESGGMTMRRLVSILVLSLVGVTGLVLFNSGCGGTTPSEAAEEGENAEELGICNDGGACFDDFDCAKQCERCEMTFGIGICVN